MDKDRYTYVCSEAEAGRDTFVIHPASLEEGVVSECILPSNHLVVKTPEGKKRCWDYHTCEELSRLKNEWPRH
ncbi:hypothetical protein [Malonomonas rubra]|uniref:hypothetical protein n=1 Tax=Malonomonas rubra TaxID=57040 RepID=UPI0026EEE2FD|nr:hypothetical protein [Malonomonas rubra]